MIYKVFPEILIMNDLEMSTLSYFFFVHDVPDQSAIKYILHELPIELLPN